MKKFEISWNLNQCRDQKLQVENYTSTSEWKLKKNDLSQFLTLQSGSSIKHLHLRYFSTSKLFIGEILSISLCDEWRSRQQHKKILKFNILVLRSTSHECRSLMRSCNKTLQFDEFQFSFNFFAIFHSSFVVVHLNKLHNAPYIINSKNRWAELGLKWKICMKISSFVRSCSHNVYTTSQNRVVRATREWTRKMSKKNVWKKV